MIHLGYQLKTGEPVEIPVTHTFVAATTGRGKSVTAEALIRRAKEQGLRVVVVDPKDPPDYLDIGEEHPIVIKGISDPLTIKRLLESSSKLWLRRELPELIQVCRQGDTWTSVLAKVRERKEGKLHPIVKERLEVLELLLSRLVDEMKALKISQHLQLSSQVMRISLQHLSVGLQQLCVKDLAEQLLEKHTDVILFIDEFHRFVPRGTPSACRDALVRLIQEGRAKKVWLWGCNQTITTVDEQVRKQMQLWITGGQTEMNEADRVLDQLLPPLRLSRQDVYTLDVGQFIVNDFLKGEAVLAYVQPAWLPDEPAKRIALGQLSAQDAIKARAILAVDDPILKEENERLQQKIVDTTNELQNELALMSSKIKEDMEEMERLKKEKLEDDQLLQAEREAHMKCGQKRDELLEQIGILKHENEAYGDLKGAFLKLGVIADQSYIEKCVREFFERESMLERQASGLLISKQEADLTVEISREKVTAEEATTRGQLALLIAEGEFKNGCTTTTVLKKVRNLGYPAKETQVQDELFWFAKQRILSHVLRGDGSHMWIVRDPSRIVVKEAR